MTLLCHYPWPGNVRELANAVERAVVLCEGELIPPELFPFAKRYVPADDTLAAVEAHHIRRVLAAYGWNITQAVKVLGIDRVTLYHKMKRYNISRP